MRGDVPTNLRGAAMTLIEEMVQAARGLGALLAGRRNASDYFDLGPRGLAGSFVAFLTATAINAYLPLLMGMTTTERSGHAWQAILMVLLLFGLQVGASAIILKQFGRLDGLVPYLVADNWATFFVTLISVVFGLLGLDGTFMLFATGVVVLVIEVNIARLIVTLSPWQIAGFLVAQLVGVAVGLLVLGLVLPAPPGAVS